MRITMLSSIAAPIPAGSTCAALWPDMSPSGTITDSPPPLSCRWPGQFVHVCNEIPILPVMSRGSRERRFDALARRHADDLFRFGVWLCGDHALAKDLVQETFMRAWKALDTLNDVDAAKGWLVTILRREYARTFERKVPPLNDVDGVDPPQRDELGPDERAERTLLRRAIGRLDSKYREPLLLQVIMGMSTREIAGQLDLTESAVMTRVFRAREKLKAGLESGDSKDGKVHELS